MEEIGSQFLAKVRFLTYCLKLRSLGDDPAQLEELQDVEKEIRFLETSLREMKRKLHQEQQALQESKELAAALEMNAARIEHMEQNMPSKLPAPKQLNTSFTISSSSSISVHNNNTSTQVLSTVVSQQESTRPQTGSKQSQQKGSAKKNQLAPLSKIAYVKVNRPLSFEVGERDPFKSIHFLWSLIR